MEEEKEMSLTDGNFKVGMKDGIISIFTLVTLLALVAFNGRINELEIKNERIVEIEKKVDHITDLLEQSQRSQMEFYKENSAALDYSKRQLQK